MDFRNSTVDVKGTREERLDDGAAYKETEGQ